MQGSQIAMVNSKFSMGFLYGDWITIKKLMIVLIIGMLPMWLLRYRINALSFGKEQARALGVNTNLLGIIVLLTSTFMEAYIIAMFGIVGWVGLVVPHISRLFVGADLRRLLPMSMLTGAIMVLAAQAITQLSYYLTVGIVVSLIGTPVFLYLLAKNRGAVE
jgi:iron complex transport system permease protein